MFQKNTKDLFQELIKETDISEYFNKNEDELLKSSFSQYLNDYMEKLSITKSELIKKSDLNRNYGYEIINGKKLPSRDKVIAISIGLELNLEETQRFLKISGNRELYPRDKRDTAIIYGITQKMSIFNINEFLFDKGFRVL